ncbi:MAG: tyrosine-type recombinase/integrase [Solobacterium sp.]|nr:tyrosine-type recombinase/integrase [Solobacterium sp.]
MTIGAKKEFIDGVRKDVGDILTLTMTDKVTDIIDSHLSDYELNRLDSNGKIDTDSISLLKAYLDAKRTEGRSQKTINRYSYIIEKALKDIGIPIGSVSVYDIRSYLMGLIDGGMQASSVEGVRSVLSAMFGWLWKEQLIKVNPCANVGAIKVEKKERLPFSDVEIQLILDACTDIRNTAIIRFLLSTGCRVSELCDVRITDVDLSECECRVHGKGNKWRTVYFDSATLIALKKYLATRTDSDPYLFTGLRGKIKPQGIRAMLKKIERESGVENVHPHRFRRTLATNLINRGMPIQEVACILGHDKIDTTMKYVYIEKQNVKNAYKKFI